MRKKAERQVPLDFSGGSKVTREHYRLYYEIDRLLNQNPEVLDAVHADLAEGERTKLKHNVSGVTSETILRFVIVQAIEDLSLRDLMIRVEEGWTLRFFVKVYDDALPHFSTYQKLVNCIRPETWERINELVVRFAKSKKGRRGRKLRLDTTAVETDIAYPTDAKLLSGYVRIVGRLMGKVRRLDARCVGKHRSRVRDSVRLERRIGYEARGRNHKSKLRGLFRKLIGSATRMAAWSKQVERSIREVRGLDRPVRLKLLELGEELSHYRFLGEKVVSQAHRRVLRGETVPNDEKLFSLFEPHTELLIRGKAGKPIEFGHMVEIHQVEGGLISHYVVHAKKPAEAAQVLPALEHHRKLFGGLPEVCAADKGFYAGAEMDAARDLGVRRVAIPKKGRRDAEEKRKEHSAWFRMAQRFRAGIEGTISCLKRGFGLKRCMNHGWERFCSWVGARILAHNLVNLART